MTYSILARDPQTGAIGAAVQSHFFGVGAIAPWARAGVGAVATQGFAEVSYGPRGLDRLAAGEDVERALSALTAADPGAEGRQVAMLDARGEIAVHTGARCIEHAGHRVGGSASVQGNMLREPSVWPAILEGYRRSTAPTFAHRLLDALGAGEAQGGDIRGCQSAAILVVAAEAAPHPAEGVLVDLRVDDHRDPLAELRRLADLQIAYGEIGALADQPGLLVGDASTVTRAVLDDAVATLTAAQEVLGDNPEADFWQAVVLARAGDIERARARLAAAAKANPALPTFFRRLPAAGILPNDESLLDAVAPRGGDRDTITMTGAAS
ncbi:MAG: DUF1028 domain-containing protein [Acidimicrobiales bacterium]